MRVGGANLLALGARLDRAVLQALADLLDLRLLVAAQLRVEVVERRHPDPVRRGAEDESEMGAFRRRYEPQRHADLLTRLDEYLRVGLEAGIFYES